MNGESEILSEAEALRLWQKAAQLQADAARRAEALVAGEAPEGVDGADSRKRDAGDGYALVHVRAAALEAGIGAEYVDAALAEVRADRAARGAGGSHRYRWSRSLLGNPPDQAVSRRVIRAEPAAVLEAMEEVLPHDPFSLLLRERVGDPLSGGTLVFDIQGVGFTTAGAPGFKADAAFADLRQVYITLSPVPGDPARTEVTLRAPVTWALRLNAVISGVMSVGGGALGLAIGIGAGTALLALGPVVPGLVAAASAGGSGALSLWGFRKLYRYGLGRGFRALETLLATVAARAEGGWGIAPPRT